MQNACASQVRSSRILAHDHTQHLPRARFVGLALVLLVSTVGCTSSGSTKPVVPDVAAAPLVIQDDYEAARARADADGRPLLVSFTGHTCVNCRRMEADVFEREAIAALRAQFIEARLHSDASDPVLRADIKLRAEAIAGSFGQPTYVALDPRSGAELARYEGLDQSGGEQFRAFLDKALQLWRRGDRG